MIRLSTDEVKRAARMARRDYEICNLLAAYRSGNLDEEGIEWLLEEISEDQVFVR